MTTGAIVFAHGSRIESANQAVRDVAAELARKVANPQVLAAFLELGDPSLESAAAQLAAAGVSRIVILPYFLTLGLHMDRDLPRLIERISSIHNGLEIVSAPPLEGHPALAQILADRLEEVSGSSRQNLTSAH
ncbi:MAG TPA: CbiX/SirB N-terminal domain-containing protein [Verrucomicrobiae bacterium]|nr:CbiX/SirB N-terminal domain-containing protein [Verrucomicrobiae bacterium]